MATHTTPAVSEAETPEQIRALLKRAQAGDEGALPRLRALFERSDRFSCDIAQAAREAVVGQAAGKDLAARELMLRDIERVAAELAGPDPSPMERLLAERAALCWHQVNQYERAFAQARDLTIRQAEFAQKKIDGAHRRYLSALKTLATVRKLAVPALQVNIGRNQVNLAGAAVASPG